MHWAQQSLHNHSGDRMFKAVIPETVKLREAPSHGISIFEYDSNGIGAKAYKELMALKRSILGNNRLARACHQLVRVEKGKVNNQSSKTR